MTVVSYEYTRRRLLYLFLRRRGVVAFHKKRLDDALYWLFVAGTIASEFHQGRWSDRKADRLIKQIASSLFLGSPPKTKLSGYAHLTSFLMDGGGHSKVLLSWSSVIKRLNLGEQHLLSTELLDSQKVGPTDLRMLQSYVQTIALAGKDTLIQRVQFLVERLFEIGPKKIILHINPNDVAALCSASIIQQAMGTDLLYVDHADHGFAYGGSLADKIIENRTSAMHHAAHRRGVNSRKVGYVPPILTQEPTGMKGVRREDLGIPSDATVSLTITRGEKIRSDGHWDYGLTIQRILSSFPTHHHLLVGKLPPDVVRALESQFVSKPEKRLRLHILDVRADVNSLISLSDFLIESFPIAGLLVRLQCFRQGKPLVAIRNDKWAYLEGTDLLPSNYPFIAGNNQDVIDYTCLLIESKERRTEVEGLLKRFYFESFSNEQAKIYLETVLLDKDDPNYRVFPRPRGREPHRYLIKLSNSVPGFPALMIAITNQLGYRPPRQTLDRIIDRLATEDMKRWPTS